MIQKTKILLLVLFLTSFKIQGQNIKSDSVAVVKIVNDFYEWYINSTKNEKNEENRPVFIVDKKETIRLEYTKYLQNLRKYNFSESLIKTEVLSYKNCEQNLKKLTTAELQVLMIFLILKTLTVPLIILIDG